MTVIDLISCMEEDEIVTVYGVVDYDNGVSASPLWLLQTAGELMNRYENASDNYISKTFAQQVASARIYESSVHLVIYTNIDINSVPMKAR